MKIQPHEICYGTYTSKDLGVLCCLDHNYSYLSDVTYENTGSRDEPKLYRQKLKENILKKGVQQPILVFQEPNGRRVLVEGHHRSIVAYNHNLIVPVEIHKCSCQLVNNFLGLCENILEAAEKHKGQIVSKEWECLKYREGPR